MGYKMILLGKINIAPQQSGFHKNNIIPSVFVAVFLVLKVVSNISFSTVLSQFEQQLIRATSSCRLLMYNFDTISKLQRI